MLIQSAVSNSNIAFEQDPTSELALFKQIMLNQKRELNHGTHSGNKNMLLKAFSMFGQFIRLEN